MFEMPSVVDMVPEAPERFKGKINWVKVCGLAADKLLHCY